MQRLLSKPIPFNRKAWMKWPGAVMSWGNWRWSFRRWRARSMPVRSNCKNRWTNYASKLIRRGAPARSPKSPKAITSSSYSAKRKSYATGPGATRRTECKRIRPKSRTVRREKRSVMHWQFTPYVIPEIISVAISVWLALVAWRRRSAPGATAFILLMLGVALWSLGNVVTLGSSNLPTVVFWDNVTWLGTVMAPTAWFVFALQYTGRAQWLTRRVVVLLVVEPLVTLLLAWTNGAHGLITSSLVLNTSASYTAQIVTYGAWFWVNVVYTYLLILLGTLLIGVFIQALVRSASLYRGQVGALLIATIVPWVASVLTISGLSPFPALDLTPLGFTITGLALAWCLFRSRLLDLAPVARHAVVERMSDAVIVLDQRNRITDLNPAAQAILGRPLSALVGQPFAEVASHWPEQVERYSGVMEAHEEMVLTVGEMPRSFDLRISPLYHRSGSFIGR